MLARRDQLARRDRRRNRERRHCRGSIPAPPSAPRTPRIKDNVHGNRNPALAGPLGTRPRILHDPGRLHDRLGREPAIMRELDADINSVHLGDERVPARVRRAAAHHRPPRRPLRPEERSTSSAWSSSRWHPPGAASPATSTADRGPRRAGLRRGDDDAADDGRHHPHLPAASSAARRWASGAPSPASRRSSARSSAACWSTPLGWEWIFFVNVPVGVVAFILAWRLVPKLATHKHRFDWLGVVLSALGMFLVVFGIQEGESYDWGTISGPITVWGLIITGIVVFAAFVGLAGDQQGEPLLPLGLFRDRNFALSNAAITTRRLRHHRDGAAARCSTTRRSRPRADTVGAACSCRWPSISGVLAPFVGRLVDRVEPASTSRSAGSRHRRPLAWLGSSSRPMSPLWHAAVPIALLGLANAGIWAPLAIDRDPQPAAAAGRRRLRRLQHDPADRLGARSAGIAALMNGRLAAEAARVHRGRRERSSTGGPGVAAAASPADSARDVAVAGAARHRRSRSAPSLRAVLRQARR